MRLRFGEDFVIDMRQEPWSRKAPQEEEMEQCELEKIKRRFEISPKKWKWQRRMERSDYPLGK